MGQPGLFFVYFWSFQTNNTIFTTNQCEKMSYPSSIRRRDLNPRSLECESPPITTTQVVIIFSQNVPNSSVPICLFTNSLGTRIIQQNLAIIKAMTKKFYSGNAYAKVVHCVEKLKEAFSFFFQQLPSRGFIFIPIKNVHKELSVIH